jgi:hypothetical protein
VVIAIKHIVNFVMKELKVLAVYKTFKDLKLLKFFKIRYAYMMFFNSRKIFESLSYFGKNDYL